MVYNAVPLEAVNLPLGKGGRIYKASDTDECQIASLFKKVYVNGIHVDYPFVIVLIKEQSESHNGRRGIKYSDKNDYTYHGEHFENKEFIRKARVALSINDNACWFVYAIEIENQDELHLYAVVVDDTNSCVYGNSYERKKRWLDLIPETNDYKDIVHHRPSDGRNNTSIQQIYYGVPGTGKSNTIKRQTEAAERNGRVFRTTFHPDSDYATFVGCYKPTMSKKPVRNVAGDVVKRGEKEEYEEVITYKFIPQAFTNAYTRAWNTQEEVYLVIEEINRGNCAQIFGDLFQLLDRGADGRSEYPIEADSDLASHIAKALAGSTRSDFPDGVREGKKLVLPENLYIWATMNTSDQSLFPIDSAFKRRWDWHYLPIEDAGKGWKIRVNGNEYDWYAFLEAINKEVLALTHSEDKQLGYFFAKAKDGIIDAETLVNKVYFYLWTDVFKDYDIESQRAFRKANGNEAIAFKDFFTGQGVNEAMVEQVLINLELNKPETTAG